MSSVVYAVILSSFGQEDFDSFYKKVICVFDSPDAGQRFIIEFYKGIDILKDHPEICLIFKEIARVLFLKIFSGKYVAIYEIQELLKTAVITEIHSAGSDWRKNSRYNRQPGSHVFD